MFKQERKRKYYVTGGNGMYIVQAHTRYEAVDIAYYKCFCYTGIERKELTASTKPPQHYSRMQICLN